jgi:HK97 family phage prohead protease/HK97 family phage major capsid protein
MRYKELSAPFIKIDAENRIVAGYASTPAIDSYGDMVEPTAFSATMLNFMKNPIMFFGHQWFNLPIGKIISYDIRNDGLWVEAKISETAKDIWQLIKEGILKGFSIGFDIPEGGADELPGGGLHIKLLRLLEISIVNIPANPETLIELAKSHNIELKSINIASSGGAEANHKGVSMKTLEQLQEQVDAQDKTIGALSTQLDEAKTKLASVKVNENMFNITDNLVKAQRESQAEFNQALEKMQDAFFEKYDEYIAEQRKHLANISQPSKFEHDLGIDLIGDYKIRDRYEFHTKLMAKPALAGSERTERMIKELQRLNDELYTAVQIQRMGLAPEVNLKQTQLWGDYQRLSSEFRKALDTATSTEGSEWIPVGYSNQLFQAIEDKLVIANLFPTIQMSMPSLVLPSDLAQQTAYYIPENTDDIGTLMRAFTPASSNATLSVKKFGVRSVASQEMVEDSLFALIPFMMRKVQTACARAIEDVTLNGDDASSSNINGTVGTHIYTYDARYAMDGLRVMTQTAAKKDFNDTGSSYTLDNIRAIYPLMGNFWDPTRCAHLVGLKLYIKLLSLKDGGGSYVVNTVDKLGSNATILRGQLAVLDGMPVIMSQFVKEDLNGSFVYDGSTVTKTLHMIINPDGFVKGFRRTIKVASAQDIETDQQKVVATVRYGFQKWTGTSLYPVAFGYDINHS